MDFKLNFVQKIILKLLVVASVISDHQKIKKFSCETIYKVHSPNNYYLSDRSKKKNQRTQYPKEKLPPG